MSNVINKKTGQYLSSVHTPDYKSADWIINPTQSQITQYTPEPVEPTESELALIELSQSDTSMVRVIDDILDFIVNDTPIPQSAKDKLNNRKALRDKL